MMACIVVGISTQHAVHAGISPLVFNNVFALFKPEHIYYAPQFGSIALSSGIIENLRFFNVIPGIGDDGKRRYSRDEAPDNDPIMEIILILFPSPAGQLTTERNLASNIGKYCRPKHVAGLLNFTYRVRQYLQKNNVPLSTDINELLGAQELNYQDEITQDFRPAKFNQTNLSSLLVKIAQAIEQELINNSDQSFYPKYFVEQIINAFFCHKFANQNAVERLMSKLNMSKLNMPANEKRESPSWDPYLRALFPIGYELFLLYKKKYAPKKIDNLTLSDLQSLDKLWVEFHGHNNTNTLPYANNNLPISCGTTQFYNRAADRLSSNKDTFVDCVEVSMRHIVNFFLYDHRLSSFNVAPLYKHMKKHHNPYIKNLENFYAIQSPEQANSGDITLRSTWNKVIANLKHSHGIRYLKQFESVNNNNELKSGMLNMMKVFNAIFSLDLGDAPSYTPNDTEKFLIKAQDWVKNGFQKMSAIINSNRTCSVTFSKVDINEQVQDIIGRINITMLDRKTLASIFSTTIKINYGHTYIEKLSSLIVSPRNQLAPSSLTQAKTISSRTRAGTIIDLLFALLQISDTENGTPDAAMSPSLQLFKISTNENEPTINTLNALIGLTQRKIISDDISSRILSNILKKISWDHTETVRNAMTTIIKLKDLVDNKPIFSEIIKKEVQALALSHNDDSKLLTFFTNIKYLYIQPTATISNLTLPRYTHLKTLSVQGAANLESITFTNLMDELDTINFNESGVKRIIGYNLCPNINQWPTGIELIRSEAQ